MEKLLLCNTIVDKLHIFNVPERRQAQNVHSDCIYRKLKNGLSVYVDRLLDNGYLHRIDLAQGDRTW